MYIRKAYRKYSSIAEEFEAKEDNPGSTDLLGAYSRKFLKGASHVKMNAEV